MKTHRFIGDFSLKTGSLNIKDKDFLNQFRNVLKLKVGEKIILGDGKGNEGAAEIKEYGKDFVKVEISEIKKNHNEPEIQAILYCAILKKENFELVVQKATEVGVTSIVPIISARTVKLNLRMDRLDKIAKEAAEQSGRGIVPVIHEPISFKESVEVAKNNDLNTLFDISGVSFSQLGRLNNQNKIGVWIGPEGGWEPQELELIRKSDFKIISLSKFTLRAETAVIVAAYNIIHNL